MPAFGKPVGIDAREEARKVLVVDQRGRFVIKLGCLEELDEFENVALGQVVWESGWDELIEKLGYAIEHGPEWSRERADDRTTRMDLFLPFWQYIGVG